MTSIRNGISWPIFAANPGHRRSPYNVSVTWPACRLPSPSAAAGLVGDDDLGRVILDDCRRHGIDPLHLRSTPLAPTSYTDVMTEERRQPSHVFSSSGANALWDGADLDFKKHKARIFHLGYLLLLDALDAPDPKFGTKAAGLLHAAQQAGMKTSVDVVSEDSDRFARIVSPALKYVDYCILNEIEAGKTTGFKIREANGRLNTVSLRHAAGALLQGRRARSGCHSLSRRRLHAHPQRRGLLAAVAESPRATHRGNGRGRGRLCRGRAAGAARGMGIAALSC